ncbi:hypothetical protein ACQP00_47015 [Dactylosporangium sp. CS-047395]|uniref:hypothetical protein n=1 Tax=Dactylosporangium sp. CS-047395 TaxID=3239936 RepID=UPI003D8A961B
MMDDDDLERDLARALDAHDPVPSHLDLPLLAAFDARVDAELAALVFDSLTTTTTRGAGGPRALTFEGTGLAIEAELSPERRLVVRLEPQKPTLYELWSGGTRHSGRSDALGRFALTIPSAGPFRLRCEQDDAPPVITPWLSA